jgi:hypothetical protein
MTLNNKEGVIMFGYNLERKLTLTGLLMCLVGYAYLNMVIETARLNSCTLCLVGPIVTMAAGWFVFAMGSFGYLMDLPRWLGDVVRTVRKSKDQVIDDVPPDLPDKYLRRLTAEGADPRSSRRSLSWDDLLPPLGGDNFPFMKESGVKKIELQCNNELGVHSCTYCHSKNIHLDETGDEVIGYDAECLTCGALFDLF